MPHKYQPLLSVVVVVLLSGIAFSQVTINYNNRSSGAWIPSRIIGAQQSFATTTGMTALNQASYRLTRIDAQFSTVFAGGLSNPNWTNLENNVKTLRSLGFTPIIVVDYLPSYLAYSSTACPNSNGKTAPTSITEWSKMAAALVQHMDTSFPGFVTYYEIWNEPNVTFCYPPNDTATGRANYYTAMYGSAANAMRNQNVTDQGKITGVKSILIGGPATSDVGSTLLYLPILLKDTTAAPNVNFVSYHKYPAGTYDTTHGELWDKTSSSGDMPLYCRLRSTWSGAPCASSGSNSSGIAASYIKVANAVRTGIQPNPYQTPILVTEYNANWSANMDCCRNDWTYSPLLNSVWMIEQLNVGLSGYNEPAAMIYFSASTSSLHDCLVGQIDTAMDCSSMASQAYPQLYTYKLIASPSYLNLNAGGHLAKSVSASYPLHATGFYTGAGIAALITNPLSNSVTVMLTLQNAGGSSTTGTRYLLNNSNRTISASSITFAKSSTGLTAQLTVPAYSVIGIKLP